RWLLDAFEDRRYIRVDGRPLFLVYRARHLPDPRRTADRWRDEARRRGVAEPMLGMAESFDDERGVDPRSLGFDAAVEFMPDGRAVGATLSRWRRRYRWLDRVGLLDAELRRDCEAFERHNIFSYPEMVDR